MSAVAAAVVGTSVYGAYTAKEEGKKNRRAANEQAQLSHEVSMRQLDLSEEQWNTYVDTILPMEIEAQQMGLSAQELALKRGEKDYQLYTDFYAPLQEDFVTEAREGVEGQFDRVARDAGDRVDQQFDRERQMTRRALERKGVRPDAGSYGGTEEAMSHAQAAARANTINQAVESERDRVEDTNFNRKAVALGRTPMNSQPIQATARPAVNPNSAGALMRSAANGFSASADRYTSMANQSTANAGAMLNSGLTAGANLYAAFRPQTAPAVPDGVMYNQGGVQTYNNNGYNVQMYKDGGEVQPPQAQPLSRHSGGMVDGPGGVDNVPASIQSSDGQMYDARLSDGEYVIPVDVVRAKGTDFFDALIEKHHNKNNSMRRGR